MVAVDRVVVSKTKVVESLNSAIPVQSTKAVQEPSLTTSEAEDKPRRNRKNKED